MATATRPLYPDGHFYSPVVDVDEAERDRGRIWPEPGPTGVHGIDFNRAGHLKVLNREFPRYYPDYQYPRARPDDDPTAFYEPNGQYGALDSRVLFVLLRSLRPKRMVEVGSGFSTLLTADVNRRFLGGGLEFTCVEPYPPAFLLDGGGVPGVSRLIVARVQDVPVAELTRLGAGDVLFIDSSHVAKTGSDVNHLFFEVLPRLRPGVVVHVHDVFLPDDYPEAWVREGRSWNEQYLDRALLTFSSAYRVLFGSRYACAALAGELTRALGGRFLRGHALWLVRTRLLAVARARLWRRLGALLSRPA
jgi:predicted O-methyltransferase YrrM